MSRVVVFRRLAKRELDDAILWYEDRRKGLGYDFSVAVQKHIARISISPEQFPRVRGDVRKAVLRRFPYSIYFITDKQRIVVLAIFHVRRDPQHLESRA